MRFLGKMDSGKIAVHFFQQRGYLFVQLIKPADYPLGLLREVHAGSAGLVHHKLHPETLLGSLHASPSGSIGHAQFFRRGIQAMAFVDGLEQNIPPRAEYGFPVIFHPDLVLDFHAVALSQTWR